jgi:hypothetical protein
MYWDSMQFQVSELNNKPFLLLVLLSVWNVVRYKIWSQFRKFYITLFLAHNSELAIQLEMCPKVLLFLHTTHPYGNGVCHEIG